MLNVVMWYITQIMYFSEAKGAILFYLSVFVRIKLCHIHKSQPFNILTHTLFGMPKLVFILVPIRCQLPVR